MSLPQHQHLIASWKDYSLIDSGEGEKLERFGKYILRRPEPQALWKRKLDREWNELWHGRYERVKGSGEKLLNSERGNWVTRNGMPESWYMDWHGAENPIKFRLALTAFGHVGVFPEQSANWEFITKRVNNSAEECNVLNLFAYTGGATLAAAVAGAKVTHVDSIRQTVNWANQNVQENQLNGVRWMIEDAFKFVSREVRRGNRYQGIILDPPAYGRGPAGEKWVFDDDMEALTSMCIELLVPHGFCIINIYSIGHSPLVLHNMVQKYRPEVIPEAGELVIVSETGQALPLSAFYRF